jgi:hypothetical protein
MKYLKVLKINLRRKIKNKIIKIYKNLLTFSTKNLKYLRVLVLKT